MDLYLGIMSGTSLDAIDLAICESDTNGGISVRHFEEAELPATIRQEILALNTPGGENEISRLMQLDQSLAETFANAALNCISNAKLKPDDIKAIGSHGQTIRHNPPSNHDAHAYSLQIGNANTIAWRTNICTVADFRNMDIAAGGEGAPLVPSFHEAVFSSETEDRFIVNIGGMANITVLASKRSSSPLGYDTGPGNVLLDTWIQQHQTKSYDHNGDWARTGCVNNTLLNHMLAEPYFQLSAPKSTGRETFNLHWINSALEKCDQLLSPADVQATLLELSCQIIFREFKKLQTDYPQAAIYLCGGGSLNQALCDRLRSLTQCKISNTAELGIAANALEAAAFAWLAKQRLDMNYANTPSVTGAKQQCLLGAIYQGHRLD